MKPEASATEPSTIVVAASPDGPSRRWAWAFGLLLAVVLLAAILVGIAFVWIDGGFAKARRLAKQGQWEAASGTVAQYLWLRPHDDEARLFAAEALYRAADDADQRTAAVRESLRELEWIPDDSRQGPEARLRAAGMLFMILKQPYAAESQLRRAIARDPNWIQPYLLLWRVLDATGRSDFAEPVVREVLRLAPPHKRVVHLRSWYLSQFAPAAATLDLDLLWGVVAADELPSPATELARYDMFRTAEPDSPIHVAATARVLLLRKQQAQTAVELLKAFDRPSAAADLFFASVQAEATHAAGETESFEAVLQNWPGPRDGYDFLKWDGVRLQENADDPAAAAASYRRALGIWPGPVDWQVVFRLSNCLRRLGEVEEAERLKTRSEELGQLIGDEYHRPLRDALADLSDTAAVAQAVDLYRRIERPWEARLWSEHLATLRQEQSAIPN